MRQAVLEAARATQDPAIGFTEQRLARVREQLARIDAMLLDETDPAKLDRLAAASMRLSDQEFALANRPKPAQARVTQTRLQSAKPKPVLLNPTADTTTPSVPPASPDPNSPK